MATRDYAKRGRKPRAKGRKAASKPAFPWLRLVLVIALIGGFGYFLWSIQGASDGQPVADTPVAVPVTKPKPAKAEPALPEKPQETWEYIETLPEKEVEVEVPKQELGGPYQMQCGSFRKQSQAEAMKAKIAFMGMESQVRRTTGSNGVWFRVVLGPYERKRVAESERHKVQRGGINGCQIWLWN
ncbi:cell division protein FtsN [Ferrimonas sediminum]|uniref:Cell division protein FtsN n=1 Tax=Ferrimonas sediminum TaxID=718193 RepID=A0A1G8K443_9GAMM|nr:SPOR domain-containing protein [Ferrimonas sediminum]SDI38173.1 cell division protein FtsN [Ferrimonas sediminum]